ncbi:hypothetical protein HAX54_015882, partial [Datura stramonium]|nr:hypothetical protein [Datura stramonium]
QPPPYHRHPLSSPTHHCSKQPHHDSQPPDLSRLPSSFYRSSSPTSLNHPLLLHSALPLTPNN